MGSNTLNNLSAPKKVEIDDVNQYFTALTGDVFPRNATTGATENDVHSLGSLAVQWKDLYAGNVYIDGTLFDPDNVGTGTDSNNAIVSGATRSGSGQPDFIRASGSGASCTILATTTNLQITANGTSVTVSSDIAVSSLTVAPSINNTCLVNDTSLTDQPSSKYTGEHEADPLTIDTAGSEITDRVGQYICLKGASEYMLAFVESSTTLRHVYRGFFFDSSGNPIVRETLANNDTLTIMSLGWVFLQNDGVTVDVSYKSPIYSYTEPTSPATDDYWFDLANRVWKRYSGSAFITIDRMLIGLVVIDGTNCVASRSFDFTKSFSDFIKFEVELESVTIARSKSGRNAVSVYGQVQEYMGHPVQFDITTDLETGLTEATSTLYYLYVTENGDKKISTERPYNRMSDLRGYYHPYHTWRYVGVVYNNSSSDFSSVNSLNSEESRIDTFTTSGEFLSIPNRDIKVIVQAGGGGGGGVNVGSTGGTSLFDDISCTGGAGGNSRSASIQEGGAGGSASGGDININGTYGGYSNPSVASGRGADSTLGSGGASRIITAGNNNGRSATGFGAGGSGGDAGATSQACAGGASGARAESIKKGISGRIAVTVGAGGSGGSGTPSGGSGSGGVIFVEYI